MVFDLGEQRWHWREPRPLGPGAGGEIAGTANAQGFAEFGDGIECAWLDQGIPLAGSSESMLIAFFRISRWRRRYSIFALQAADLRRRIGQRRSATAWRLRRRGLRCAPLAERPVPPVAQRVGRHAQFQGTCLRGRPLLISSSTAPCRNSTRISVWFWHMRSPFFEDCALPVH